MHHMHCVDVQAQAPWQHRQGLVGQPLAREVAGEHTDAARAVSRTHVTDACAHSPHLDAVPGGTFKAPDVQRLGEGERPQQDAALAHGGGPYSHIWRRRRAACQGGRGPRRRHDENLQGAALRVEVQPVVARLQRGCFHAGPFDGDRVAAEREALCHGQQHHILCIPCTDVAITSRLNHLVRGECVIQQMEVLRGQSVAWIQEHVGPIHPTAQQWEQCDPPQRGRGMHRKSWKR